MPTVESSIRIGVPPSEVTRVLLDADLAPRWTTGLERLELIDLSSSGNDWYYAWVHNQMKDTDLYLNIIRNDAADALREITQITHADGRSDKDPAHKIIREGASQRRMETVGGWTKLMLTLDANVKARASVEKYVSAEKTGTKFDLPKQNEYDKY